ncbi:MAG: helix-turn-helix domain-containing protein [Fimbriimonadaceae bacterium]|nr:helix-turn-helix domain-containing protein [Fimbriimonadaceae bacterium]
MKTKAEAAEFLGISVRTLERYTRSKRIPATFDQGKRHARLLYAEADLEALRTELAAEKAVRFPEARSVTAMQRIGFRLEPVDLKRLTQLAAREHVSPGEYGRHLVISALHDTSATELKGALSDIQLRLRELQEDLESKDRELRGARTALAEATRAMDQLRADLPAVLQMLLVQLTDAEPAQIKAWIREGLSSSKR